ncbi:MAG: sugar nucleotide-binding protein [Nanoarchaeota archaeon]|nr:sugar nucleotide-binding protein [Nanoarchaeota archaeon]
MWLLFGSQGRLGSSIMHLRPDIVGLSHADVDVTDRKKVLEVIKNKKPEAVINCTGLTNVDYCEENKEEAWNVNVRGTRNMSEGARSANAYMVHFSSDYAINPVNEYAWTKLASESLVDGLVIRANYYDKSSWLMWNILAKNRIKLLTTEFLNPISSLNLINIMMRLIEKKYKGVINIGTKNKISFYEFGCAIAGVYGIDNSIIEPVEKLERKVPRSNDCYMDLTSLKKLKLRIFDIKGDLEMYKTSPLSKIGGSRHGLKK